MRRSSTVSTSRHLDAHYDPLYLSGSAGPTFPTPAASQPAAHSLYRPTDPAATADFTVRRADGSLAAVTLQPQPRSVALAAFPSPPGPASLRSAVQGANRYKYSKRPLRAFVAPAGQHLAGQQPGDVAVLSNSLTSASPFAGRLLDTASTQFSSTMATGDDRFTIVSTPAATNGTLANSAVVSVGSQSVYRESGSQTVPYSPDVLLDPQPTAEVVELLSLQSALTHANGTLPAMLDAVEIVEAARERARWESSLPSLSTPGGYERRKRMVEEREWTEWKAKEADIRAEQERTMLAIIAAQDERDNRQQQRIADALDAKNREMEQRATAAEERRREEKRRAVRLLGKQRLRDEKRTAFLTGGLLEVDANSGHFATDEEKTSSWGVARRSTAAPVNSRSIGGMSSSSAALLEMSRADAVFGAVDFSSELYAPLQRNGAAVAYAHKRTVVDFDIPALSDYTTLTALQNKAVGSLQRDAGRDETEAATGGGGERLRLPSIDRPLNRRANRERQHLMHVDALIAEQKEQTSLDTLTENDDRWAAVVQHATAASSPSSSANHNQSASAPPVNVYKHFCPVQRAPTPSLPSSQSISDGRRVAITLLQRLVRGRAQQNALISHADRRQHLIREMVQVAQHSKQQQHDNTRTSGANDDTQHDAADEASSVIAAGVIGSDSAAPASLHGAPLSTSMMVDVLVGSLLSDDVSSLLAFRQQSDALHALSSYMQQAIFVRRVREAEEAGRRQAQEELRQRQDQHYADTQATLKQHTATHHTHHILQRAIATYVQQQQEQQQLRAVVSQSDGGNEDADTVIAELLHNVLWPEVELRVATGSVSGRRFLNAAHYAVQQAICEQTPLQTRIATISEASSFE